MTVGLEMNGMAMVATDTRTSFLLPDGTYSRHDYGGKLVRLSDGWVTGSGSLSLYLSAIDRLEAVGVGNIERAWAEIADVRATAGEAVRENAPNIAEYVDGTRLMILSDGGDRPSIHEIQMDGSQVRGGLGWCFVQLPPEIKGEHRADLPGHFGNAVGRAHTVMDLVRVTAGFFASLAPIAESISRELQIGLSWPSERGGLHRKWIGGNSTELATARPESILANLEHPADLPRVDFTDFASPCA